MSGGETIIKSIQQQNSGRNKTKKKIIKRYNSRIDINYEDDKSLDSEKSVEKDDTYAKKQS